MLLAIAAITYVAGSIFFTQAFNLPLNNALADGGVPRDLNEARVIWTEYSSAWQGYNLFRTIVSGAGLALSAVAV